MRIIFTLLFLLPVVAPAQRALPAKETIWVDPQAHRQDQVVVKFAEGSHIQLLAGRFVGRADQSLGGLNGLVQNRQCRPFFAGLERELDLIDAQIGALNPGQPLPAPDLRLYFEIATTDLGDAKRLIQELNNLPMVEIAYPREKATPPPGDIPPLTPDFTAQQLWLGPAPNGLDGFAAQTLLGAWGQGITIMDIEWGWWFDHEDLSKLRASALVGPPPKYSSYNSHGTAVAGEIFADIDTWGVNGLAPDVKLLCATDYPASGYSVAQAIVVGLPFLKKGDLMLLEAQIATPFGQGPTEYLQADFDAIRKATQKMVITVEAAGNGGADLDNPAFGRIFDLTYRDSGAIIVGATNGSALARAGFSSYGSRVDVNGWGGSVTTTGYGVLFNPGKDRRQRYTNGFSGTSSASGMIAPTVATLLGAAKAQLSPGDYDKFIRYKNIRTLLRTYGTAMPSGSKIGQRPDLKKLLAGAGLHRGLTIRTQPRIGQNLKLEIHADFTAGFADGWLLLASQQPGNQGIAGFPAPFDRFLLDPTKIFFTGGGTFAPGPLVRIKLPIPNVPALKQSRCYWQAITVRSKDSRLYLTSAATCFIAP